MEWWLLPLLLGTVALVALAFVLQRAAERRRTEALQALAPMLGFSFDGESRKPGDAGLDASLRSFHLFRQGGAARVRNMMRAAMIDGEDLVFEYRYTVSTGKSSHTVAQTVAAFRRRGATIPDLRLFPENVFSKLGHLLGGQDIDFDSNVEFSAHYVLKGDDPDAVRAYFERRAVIYFADRHGWSVEGSGEWLIAYRASRREKPEDLRAWVDEVRGIARALDPR
jgi:hypothetical protein